jgi:hypothetical protein
MIKINQIIFIIFFIILIFSFILIIFKNNEIERIKLKNDKELIYYKRQNMVIKRNFNQLLKKIEKNTDINLKDFSIFHQDDNEEISCLNYKKNIKAIECEYNPKNFFKWNKLPDICLYLSMECRQTQHFFGLNNTKVQLSWSDYLFIDFIFQLYPNFNNVIEIGTFG